MQSLAATESSVHAGTEALACWQLDVQSLREGVPVQLTASRASHMAEQALAGVLIESLSVAPPQPRSNVDALNSISQIQPGAIPKHRDLITMLSFIYQFWRQLKRATLAARVSMRDPLWVCCRGLPPHVRRNSHGGTRKQVHDPRRPS